MKKSPVVTIVAIGIGAALFFVLGRFVAIPSPVPNTNISFFMMSQLPAGIAGLLIAFIGHALIDFSYGWGVWWSWVIASGCAGFIMGLAARKLALGRSDFDGKQIVRFNIYQIIAHLAAWVVIAPVLDILIYQEPSDKVFVQGLVAALVNIVTTAIIGTLLALGYSKTKPKSGSLKKED